jgi:hypothetical protein
MITICVKPVEIIGACPANLSLEDEFRIQGMNLAPLGKVCFLAIGHIPPSVWQLQSESRFFAHISCPGCTTQLEYENRVIFLLGHANKWELCQMISEYRRLTRQLFEPEMAKSFRLEAMQAQAENDFSQAVLKMKMALEEVKRIK